MKISPVKDSRALRISADDSVILVVGDLHLGISAELSEKGIEIPDQTKNVLDSLKKIISSQEADRLFLLGDIKHNVPITSDREWKNIPRFFSDLKKLVDVSVIPGNHDGDISGMLPRGVDLFDSSGTTIVDGEIGLVHGHAWPSKELMRTKTIITGHNHPKIEMKDDLGARISEPAWVRSKIVPKNLPEELRENVGDNPPRIIILPAFSELVGGGSMNQDISEEFLGPLFESNSIDLENARIHLLDGTFLGKLKNLRDLASTD